MTDTAKFVVTIVISIMTTLAIVASSWGKLYNQAETDHNLLIDQQKDLKDVVEGVNAIKGTIDILKYINDNNKEKFITYENRLGRYSDRLLRLEMDNREQHQVDENDQPESDQQR